jgi:hypothetical protein
LGVKKSGGGEMKNFQEIEAKQFPQDKAQLPHMIYSKMKQYPSYKPTDQLSHIKAQTILVCEKENKP